MEKDSVRDSAREMAVAVAGVRRAPRVFWAICIGWASAGVTLAEKASAQPMRLTTPSGEAQACASSAHPFGEGALNGFWPSPFRTGAISGPAGTPAAR